VENSIHFTFTHARLLQEFANANIFDTNGSALKMGSDSRF